MKSRWNNIKVWSRSVWLNLTSRSHLRPSQPPPVSAVPWPASPGLGPTPPPPAGSYGSELLHHPPPVKEETGERGRNSVIHSFNFKSSELVIPFPSVTHRKTGREGEGTKRVGRGESTGFFFIFNVSVLQDYVEKETQEKDRGYVLVSRNVCDVLSSLAFPWPMPLWEVLKSGFLVISLSWLTELFKVLHLSSSSLSCTLLVGDSLRVYLYVERRIQKLKLSIITALWKTAKELCIFFWMLLPVDRGSHVGKEAATQTFTAMLLTDSCSENTSDKYPLNN